MERLLLRWPERAPLPLTNLEGASAAGLEVAAAGCPDCTFLRVDLGDAGSLSPAAQLARLRELVLMSPCEPCPELAELLEARGGGLTELALNGMTEVSVGRVLKHCRSLRRLILLMCCFVDSPAPGGALPELEEFWLLEESSRPPPEDLLRRVLASPALTELKLQCCSVITDALLDDALDAGGMANLRTVVLENCDLVTLEPLLRLVVQCPRLETLQMMSCAQLSRRDAAEVRRLAEGSGWRLQVDWQ